MKQFKRKIIERYNMTAQPRKGYPIKGIIPLIECKEK